ncbi:gamma-aminobutyric acid receptor alpha-like isoform X1 [Centruroides vittatus]|uniref:gamma-aminobutyric acid receptor alpha-like isoform X1 n=3 Tax=Centruroides TaxID=6875 RepID=UPI00350EA9B5
MLHTTGNPFLLFFIGIFYKCFLGTFLLSQVAYVLSPSVLRRDIREVAENVTQNVSELLDSLLQGYDHHLRPGLGVNPTKVYIDIEVRSMGPISEVDMTFSLDCYFRQKWIDKRLAFTGIMTTLALSISMLEKIWKPDTYIYNGKYSYLHTITSPNKFVRLYQDGQVLYSSRLTIRASCPMKLANYPMDFQACSLYIGSFGYSPNDVIYQWSPSGGVAIAPDMKMSQFDVISTPTGNTSLYHSKGRKSLLVASFHLQRHIGNFIIEVYAPCTMLVVLSWVSFWINREATADRIALGITTVLTMTFLGLESRNDLPKVSYCTALDYYVAISFAFIFSTIVEFAAVHYFTKSGSGEHYFPDNQVQDASTDSEESETMDEEGSIDEKVPFVDKATTPDRIPESLQDNECWKQATERPRRQSNACSLAGDESPTSLQFENLSQNGARHKRRCSFFNSRKIPKTKRKKKKKRKIIMQLNSVSKIDRISRVLFPVIYLIINFIYWFTYLGGERAT